MCSRGSSGPARPAAPTSCSGWRRWRSAPRSALGAAALFDVSLALGAFFAGTIIAETEFAERADRESLPLRDMFAVLFFVAVGTLFDPASVLRQPLALVATVAIIVVGKAIIAHEIVRRLEPGEPGLAVAVSASLAQIGAFSFMLAAMGRELGLLPDAAADLILAGAPISIALNPVVFRYAERVPPLLSDRLRAAAPGTPSGP